MLNNHVFQLDMTTEALNACIRLNQWDKAVELSENYHLVDADLDRVLASSSDKTLAAAQLYKKAAMFLHAAKIVFEARCFKIFVYVKTFCFCRLQTKSYGNKRHRFASRNFLLWALASLKSIVAIKKANL